MDFPPKKASFFFCVSCFPPLFPIVPGIFRLFWHAVRLVRLLGVDEGRWTVQATSGVGGSSQRTSANTFQGQGFDCNAKISPVKKNTNIYIYTHKTHILIFFLPCFCVLFLLNKSLLLESTPAWFTIYPRLFFCELVSCWNFPIINDLLAAGVPNPWHLGPSLAPKKTFH